LVIHVNPFEIGSEILIAELSQIGFESFLINTNFIEAYILSSNWEKDIIKNILIFRNPKFKISYKIVKIIPENWNLKWQKNFKKIKITDKCYVRSPFHQSIKCDYEIIINPKMSFGTGHHETTKLMLYYILELPVNNTKKLIDVGCGTGILSILSEKKGFRNIDALDIDFLCYNNTKENIKLNNCKHIKVFNQSILFFNSNKYDFIFANINKNTLLKYISLYVSLLNSNGFLILSGFYSSDLNDIKKECLIHGLKYCNKKTKNSWIAVKFAL
tara:strand:- start:323 stop:1138 length:816 start_codon:yes stop_codon:yes gene_type:complete